MKTNFKSKNITFSFYVIIAAAVLIVALAGLISFYVVHKESSTQNSGNITKCPPGEQLVYPDLPTPSPPQCGNPGTIDKPVIYLYPTHDEHVSVMLSYKPGFIKTVPSYNQQTGWQVEAQPDGTLTNLSDGDTYPYLFWEGNPDPSFYFDMSTGFVVAGSNTKNFLQQQLISMGLNQNETTSFIGYWLPKMEYNPFNLIHFDNSNFAEIAKLNISPQPKSLLTVFMVYEPISGTTTVLPQSFPSFHRVDFTVVEWGGAELR